MSRNLIAYFTWSGNSERLAQQIQSVTKGMLFHIETREPYPESYQMTAAKAAKERDQMARPQLRKMLDNVMDYDKIYLVYPNWCGTVPMAVCTFLESCDFTGKRLMPLCTSGGSGIQSSIQQITKLCPTAQIGEGLLISQHAIAASETLERVKQWIYAASLPDM